MFVRIHKLMLTTTALVPLGLTPAVANPLGAQVVGGSASVQGQGTPNVTVTQTTDRAIVNWNTFNIGANEKTRFIQPSASSIALNRVTGGLGPSQIFGSLSANGRIFVVNPDGILIGAGAKIDTAGFLATTHDIANADFMAGRYNFSIPGRPDASIVNQGTITAQSAGFAALVAPGVRNSGTISARLGKVTLASGNGFSLDFYGDRLITLGMSDQIAASVKDVASGQTLRSLVSNEGKLKANGGTVELTAVAARQIVDSVINTKGVIEANSIGKRNGMIVLGAATAKSKTAGAPVQTVSVSGTLSAAGKRKGQTGGIVQVTGENIELAGATIDASGRAGGGTVLIGGDTGGGNPSAAAASIAKAALQTYAVPTAATVSVDAASSIDASAKGSGDGGKVIVWSDGSTAFNGSIAARGGAQGGNGGFVETSGHQQLAFTGTVDAGAPNGKSGTLLLDPQDVTIGTIGTWIITPFALQTALASSDVLIITDATKSGTGDITFAQNVTWGSAHALMLGAYRNVVINDGVTIKNTGAGELDLGAGVTSPNGAPWFGNGTGTIIFNGSGRIDFSNSTGYVSFGYNPIGGYSNPTNFSAHVTTNPAVSGQFNPYMWVNNVNDLQNINQNLSGKYILANTIDASATASWNGGAGFIPIGDSSTPFTGTLVGVGGSVPFVTDGATINNLTINSSAFFVGLFGYIGTAGIIANVGLTNASVDGGTFTGGLAGQSDGTIYQSFVTGSVGSIGFGSAVGGLVGVNGESGGSNAILQSYSTATVNNVLIFFPGATGGLVGHNNALIAQSYATGPATETVINLVAENSVGGLAGHNNGVVLETYAAGTVTAINTDSGGLIASNSGVVGSLGPTTVQRSYWDVQTTSQASDAAAAGTGVFNSTGLTTAQLKAGVPAGFDTSVWAISPVVNNGYPYLRWQTAAGTAVTLFQSTIGSNGGAPASNTTNQIASVTFAQQFGQTYNFTQPVNFNLANPTPLPVIPTSYTAPSNPVFNAPITTSSIPTAPQYTFKSTPYGTVEVWQNGIRISTATAEYATQQYGYNPSVNTASNDAPTTTSSIAATNPVSSPVQTSAPSSPRSGSSTSSPTQTASAPATEPPRASSVQSPGATNTTPTITLNDENVVKILFQSPTIWDNAKTLYSVFDVTQKLNSLSPSELTKTLDRLGIADTSTLRDLQTQLAGKIALEAGTKLIFNYLTNKAIDRLLAQGVKVPKPVLESVRDTIFNAATLNIKSQVVDQSLLIIKEASALNKDSASLVQMFTKQGLDDLNLMQQAIELRASGVPANVQQADRISNLVSSSLSTTQTIANELSDKSVWPSQIDVANKWYMIQKIIDVKFSQMQGRQAMAVEQINLAKDAAKSLDQINPLLNILNFNAQNTSVYQNFATQIAKSYGVVGW